MPRYLQCGGLDMTRFDREMSRVIDMYASETLDSITLKHMNAYAQSRVPGPYRLIEALDGSVCVHFDWENQEQQVMWALQWL